VRCGIISSCQSAATSKIVKHFADHKSDSRKQPYTGHLYDSFL